MPCLHDLYWSQEFEITVADMDRIADHMRDTQVAYNLTHLARRTVRGRLRHGRDPSAPVRSARIQGDSVRLWDPSSEWETGDHVILARLLPARKHVAVIGEVTQVQSHQVVVHISELSTSARYLRASPDSETAQRWRETVRRIVDSLAADEEEEAAIARILLVHGDRVAGQLLDALRDDERFVRLAGRWFLCESASSPSEEQLARLAWAMVRMDEPATTEELLAVAQPSDENRDDKALFGLYLAVRGRAELFANADPGKVPRWVLVGPPPGSIEALHAVYDPDTYEVLSVPREKMPEETVRRLWDLELLRVAIES